MGSFNVEPENSYQQELYFAFSPFGESGAVRFEYTSAEYSEDGGDIDVDGFTISAGVRF